MKTIYATVGASGSGKSTWAKKFAQENDLEIVCPDSIRDRLSGGNEGDQSRNGEVFKIAARELISYLSKGQSVCWDATSYNESNRKLIYDLAKQFGAEIEWHVFNVPLDTLIKRQDLRDRKVPTWVIEKQVNGMTMPTTGKIVKH